MTFIISNGDGLSEILEYDWVIQEMMIAKSCANGDGL
jgi:hypothetical protein